MIAPESEAPFELPGLAILRRLATRDDVASALRISSQKLSYILYRSSPSKRYTRFEIAKRSGGTRLIMAPHPALRRIQSRLADLLLDAYKPKPSVHSFVRGRSIHSNAARHVGKKHVLAVDLSDFFPSINFGRVRGLFMGKPYNLKPAVATCLAQIACFDNQLPQGAPSSPIISNMICGKMDSQLQALARDNKSEYTRYADDLAFSTTAAVFPSEIATLSFDGITSRAEVGKSLRRIIELNGFVVNDAKVRLAHASWHQEVTGLTVNRRLNVRRKFVRQIRAMLHALDKFGAGEASREHAQKYRSQNRVERVVHIGQVIRGKIEFLSFTRGRSDFLPRRLTDRFRHIDPGHAKGLHYGVAPMDGARRDVFLCHASHDKRKVVRPLFKALTQRGISAWLDEADIGWGQSLIDCINAGLKNSTYVLVCLSRDFLSRPWARKELSVALTREVSSGTTSVLPLIIGDDGDANWILHELPILADKKYVRWTDANTVCHELEGVLKLPPRATFVATDPATQSTLPAAPSADDDAE